MAANEFELIERYFQRPLKRGDVPQGIGDDCALLQPPAGKVLATTVDTLVAGNHFPETAEPDLIAERALRVNLSDLAAMGAEPLWFTLALTLPWADEHWIAGFSRGLFQAADRFHCSLVGGDTTRGPLSVTIQATGAVDPNRALLRSKAQPGDRIYVTGVLGDGAAALAVIQERLAVDKGDSDHFLSHYYRPQPRLAEGQALAGIASAAIDVSDGLLADLGHICECSGVGAIVHLERIPMSPSLRNQVSSELASSWALSGGDDYQLCFTVPATGVRQVDNLIREKRLTATAIGEITGGQGVTCMNKGSPFALNKTGYLHFDSDN